MVFQYENDKLVVVSVFLAFVSHLRDTLVNLQELLFGRNGEEEKEIVVGGLDVDNLKIQGCEFFQSFYQLQAHENRDKLFLNISEHLGNEQSMLVLFFQELSTFTDITVESEDLKLDGLDVTIE